MEPLQDTDVQGYLQHEQQQIILGAIDEGRRETLEDFNKNLARNMHSRWSHQKKRIFEELGQHQAAPAYGGNAVASTSSGRQIAGRGGQLGSSATDPPLSSLSMHTKLMSYDAVIRSLNQHRLKGTAFALATELLQLAQSSGGAPGETQTQLVECWTAVKHLVGEVGGQISRERQYSSAYADPTQLYGSAKGKELRAKIVVGARGFLEGQFETHVDNIIASNPSRAQLGGQPGVVSRIAAFLRVSLLSREGRWSPELELLKRDNNTQATPVWAIIYHLLRTGHAIDALRHAEEHEQALRRRDGAFVPWLKEWIESGGRGLSRTSKDRFFAEYNARFRSLPVGTGSGGDPSGVDPYKLSLYRIIGRVDPTKKFPNAVTRSTENWLWLQLIMTRESAIGGASLSYPDDADEDERERYTAEDLARKLKTYGEKHFDPKGRRPLHYFLILLLSGEFERAIAFLYSRSQHQTDAVHFAITLTYYGLLRCPTSTENRSAIGGEVLSIKTDPTGREIPSLDFARIIGRHIRLFSASDARSALEYIYLICLNIDDALPAETQEAQRKKCYDAVKDLVCQTRMYTDLVGDVRIDGARIPGAIEQNLKLLKMSDERDYLRQIVRSAAQQSEAEHRTRDAILLFNLAEDYDLVVSVLNRELGASLFLSEAEQQQGSAISVNGQSSSVLNPQASLSATENSAQLAQAILDTYESQNHIVRRVEVSKRETCRLLLELKKAIGFVRNGEVEKGLNTIESTDLFPLSGDVLTISRRAESFFRSIDESLARNLSELLLMTMDLLYKVHTSLKSGHHQSSTGTSLALVTSSGGESREGQLGEVRNKARALMMFAGMLRFRIEQNVFAQLTRLDAFIR